MEYFFFYKSLILLVFKIICISNESFCYYGIFVNIVLFCTFIDIVVYLDSVNVLVNI